MIRFMSALAGLLVRPPTKKTKTKIKAKAKTKAKAKKAASKLRRVQAIVILDD